MHARTEELLHHLDQTRSQLQKALDATPFARREQQPAADRWSVAGVLDHLAIVEQQVAALLKRGLRTAQAAGRLPPADDASPVLPTMDAARLLDRERRLQAGASVQPQGRSAASAWASLTASRQAVRDLLFAVDGYDTDAIQAPHPFLGALTFQQWIAFLGFHEARHAAQVRAIAAALGD